MIFEIFIFGAAGVGALFVAGYAVHMFVGGLVSVETEHQIIAIVCIMVAIAMVYMVWDVVQRRSGRR
jgi:Mn2+/Fe2+ NRAMP family transporter